MSENPNFPTLGWWRWRWRVRPVRVSLFWCANADRWDYLRNAILQERGLSAAEVDIPGIP